MKKIDWSKVWEEFDLWRAGYGEKRWSVPGGVPTWESQQAKIQELVETYVVVS